MKSFTKFIALSLLGAGSLAAQEASMFASYIGAGYTRSVGSTRQYLDNTGFNVHGGIGLKKVPHFNSSLPGVGLMLDIGYDRFGIRPGVVNSVGASDGNAQILTAMVNPIVHLSPIRHVNAYLTGGGGLIHQYQNFSSPTVASTGGFAPFFGPVNLGAGELLSSYSVNKPGYDVGGGVEFGSKFHGKMFAEARYYHMFNSHSHTDFIPVTFGFRW